MAGEIVEPLPVFSLRVSNGLGLNGQPCVMVFTRLNPTEDEECIGLSPDEANALADQLAYHAARANTAAAKARGARHR